MSAASFDELTARFLAWFKALPGATFSDAIDIKDLRGRRAGRGIGKFHSYYSFMPFYSR